MKFGGAIYSIRLVLVCILLGAVVGCTFRNYYKYFESEKLPEAQKHGYREFVFDDFNILLISYVDFGRLEPIEDSAFKIMIWATPTDTTKDGNDRFVRSFLVNSMTITDSLTGDTLAASNNSDYQRFDSKIYNYKRKRFDYGKIVIPEVVKRISLTIDVQFEDESGTIKSQVIVFPLRRKEGFERELKDGWAGT